MKMMVCPICEKEYDGHPALSRVDNKTYICPDCGYRQAMKAIGMNPSEIEKMLIKMKGYEKQ